MEHAALKVTHLLRHGKSSALAMTLILNPSCYRKVLRENLFLCCQGNS